MIDYLYYRFYRLWLCSSLAEGAAFMAMLLFSVILSTNVLIVWGILTQYSIVAYPSDVQYYIIEMCIRDRDDSSLKGLPYYPYDMVHWNENKI